MIQKKRRKLFFISNQTRDINGEMCLLNRYRWNLLDRRVCFTCVSLKSLTPTQYTIAPRVLALSACWRTGGMVFTGHSRFFFSFSAFGWFLCWSYPPLAVRWWAGAPAALRLLVRWSRWPCLEGTYRCVTGVPTALWLHVCVTPLWLRIYYYYFFSYVSLTKVLPVDLLVCLEMEKDNVRRYDKIMLWEMTYPDFTVWSEASDNKRSIRRKEYPLQSKVHECVSTRNLPFQRVQPLPDVYSAGRKHGWISSDLPHLSSLSVWKLRDLPAVFFFFCICVPLLFLCRRFCLISFIF